MKGFRRTREAKAALKSRGIKPGKKTKANPKGQATGGWSPFAAPTGQADICGSCGMTGGNGSYEAYDRVAGAWFTYKCGSC